jgi:DNA-directed RNA polymerase subunit RPC12/RpoP
MNISCPKCESKTVKKNGYTRHGKQNHRCLDCGRQFSYDFTDENFNELFAASSEGEYFISATVTDS